MLSETSHSRQSVAHWFRVVCLAFSWSLVGPAGSTHAAERPISFANDVVPVLTKSGCNMGTCHAKAGGGRNGFQLSLLGFEPDEDFEHIVLEGRGRRVSFGNPDQSLLLLKAAGQLPHGGGLRLAKSSPGYGVIREWIRQGTPVDVVTSPKLVSLEIEPKKGLLRVRASQQLKAIARYSDGSVRDVTDTALFESNDKAMADVSEGGLVKVFDLPGKVSVMVRYQGRVAVFNAAIPLGAAVGTLPPVKNFVDTAVFANLKELGIPPSPVCDDATFLRRVSLDIAGRLPTEAEAKAFLADTSADKRDKWIDELLRSPDYADFFASKWTAVLKNRRDDASDIVSNFAFHAWVRDSLLANKPYDQFVRELLGATGTVIGNPPVAWYKRVKQPKDQIEDVAQLFLGVRMQCAQCHHHPFERWSQDDYYSLAAFFAQVGRKPSGTRDEDLIFHKRGTATATNIKTREALKPMALGDEVPAISPDEDPRLRLADWMRSPKNPFFAKVLVNRYWKHFFQRGLIEPEDDIRDSNPPSNPDLLAALEKHFIDSRFDLKELVRAITRSNAYQLSATPNKDNVSDRQNYSRYYPRRLPAEVMLDAIDQLAGTQTDFPNLPPGTRAVALPDNSYNRSSPFLRVFGRPEGESVCECERVQSSNLAQSLHMINASDIRSKLASPNGRAERLAVDTRPAGERVKELYRVAFAREPRPDELKAALDYLTEPRVNAAGQKLDAPRAARENFRDLIWAIMTTKEFLFNH
ncbi:MAG: S-layer protein [Planctomycetaceae bacterium]|nr:S-layer protein [Planctomycetaceae bacterium]